MRKQTGRKRLRVEKTVPENQKCNMEGQCELPFYKEVPYGY